jgi:H+/Cl- antiporter ClcA
VEEEKTANNNYNAALNAGDKEWPAVLKSIAIGTVAGVIVTLYRYVLSIAEKFCLSAYSFLRSHPSELPVWIAFVLALGLITGWFMNRFRMAGGSGIPQVKGIILGFLKDNWFSTLIVKFIGGATAILAGLSLGREGPSIQLGACVGDGLGKLLSKSRTERKILIAGGASAGLAAAFNAPLAGVMFAFEEIFRYLSPIILLATTVSAIIADYISKIFVGMTPIFSFDTSDAIPLNAYWILILLGALTGLAGAFYNKALIWAQLFYGRLWSNLRMKILKPVPIFAFAVFIGILFPLAIGSGHSVLEELRFSNSVRFFLALLAVKFVFSIVSFLSGAPGGIFFPLLILGALLGASFGKIAIDWWGMETALFDNFIILAMAGLFTAIVRAPITGIVLLTEMTGSFTHLLSLTIVSIVAYIVANTTGIPPIYDSLLGALLEGRQEGAYESSKRVIIEFVVHHGAASEGVYIKDLSLPKQCLILAVTRGDLNIIPHGDTRILANDFLTVLCDSDSEGEIRKLLRDYFEVL